MKKEDLVLYEAPSITEYLSIGWMQTLCAKYIAWKVNRKLDRFEKRKERERFVKKFNSSHIL